MAANLASKGANIIINYTSNSSGEIANALCQELSSKHSIKAVPAQGDVGTPEGVASLLTAAKAAFPDPFVVHILVNNAGIALNDKLPEIKPADFVESYRVNVLGPILVTQAVAPYLPTDRSGRVVNMSSVSSSTGFVGQSVYGGTKAALEAMTRTWARELAERATVNAINPGPVEGPMYAANSDEFKRQIKGWIEHTPGMQVRDGVDAPEVVEDAKTSGGRPAYTGEVAGIVGMLCTPDAAWCTGQVVCANGGMLLLH